MHGLKIPLAPEPDRDYCPLMPNTNTYKTIAILGTLTVKEARDFESYGETANRTYITKVQPGTYLIELRQDPATGRTWVRCVIPGITTYYGPQGSNTYPGEHCWQPRGYELAAMILSGQGPKGCTVEAGPGISARSDTADVGGYPVTLCTLQIAGEDLRVSF